MVISINGVAQRDIEIMYVNEIGFTSKHIISTEPKKLVTSEYDIAIEMLDPVLLDSMFNNQSIKNGKFNYTFFNTSSKTFFEKRKKQKITNEYEIITNGLRWLLEKDKITVSEYNNLYNQIYEYYFESNSSYGKYRNKTNPFLINSKYLSVYRMKITNKTSGNITIKKNDFYIYSNQIKFSLLTNSELKEMHLLNKSFNNAKYTNLLKLNFSDSIVISGNRIVEKYFCTLPIIDEAAEISLIHKGNEITWLNKIDIKTINNSLKFYALNISSSLETQKQVDIQYYYAIRDIKGNTFIDNNRDKLYTNIDSEFKIVSYAIFKEKLYFNVTSSILPSAYLDLAKKKRDLIYLNSSKLIIE